MKKRMKSRGRRQNGRKKSERKKSERKRVNERRVKERRKIVSHRGDLSVACRMPKRREWRRERR